LPITAVPAVLSSTVHSQSGFPTVANGSK